MNKSINDESYLISVILPTYNGSKFISETIQSVLNQTYKNLEIILIDDNSTDNTFEIVKQFADKDSRIKLYKNDRNLGIGNNTNKALSLATGEFIMMQDHDDISSPVRAESILKVLIENPHITGCATRIYKINEYSKEYNHDISEPRVVFDDCDIHASEIFDRLILHPTVIYRKSILDKIDKPYSGDFKITSDDDLFYRLSKLGARWYFLDNRYLLYREHKNRTSVSNKILHYDERKIMVRRVISYLLPFATEEDIINHSIIQSRKEVLSYLGEKNSWIISWYRRIIDYNLENKIFNHEKLLSTMAIYWKHFVIFSNILTPRKGKQIYFSIDELKPYLESNRTFNKEWRKRFIRAMKWRFIRNRHIKKGALFLMCHSFSVFL